jgi:excisionase family DNA binding protein
MSDRLLTARQLAEMLDVSSETVLRWRRRGEIEAIRLPGGQLRFRQDAVDERLAAWTMRPGARGEASPTPSTHPTAAVLSLTSPTPEGGDHAR